MNGSLFPGGRGDGLQDPGVGLTYLLDRRTQVDVRYGSGLDQARDGQYVGAGVACRF